MLIKRLGRTIKALVLPIFIFSPVIILSACTEQENENDKNLNTKKTRVNIEQQKQRSVEQKNDVLTEKNNQEKIKDNELKPAATISLNTDPNLPPQVTAFNCDDQVYLSIKFTNPQPKLQQINISWKDPNGTERESNSFPFFVTENKTLAWASLKLHRSIGAGMLQWVNPAAGMEEFIGTWTVEVKVGDILDKTANFEVLC